jgi:hypothetical protein
MAPSGRDYTLRVRLLTAELRMLQWLADRDGLNVSDAVRQLVRKSYEERAGASRGALKVRAKQKP